MTWEWNATYDSSRPPAVYNAAREKESGVKWPQHLPLPEPVAADWTGVRNDGQHFDLHCVSFFFLNILNSQGQEQMLKHLNKVQQLFLIY